MDLLLIVRDALGNSLAGSLLLATEAKGAGKTVGVLVTQEALAALAAGTYAWPRELSGQRCRFLIADRAKTMNLPVAGRGESRRLDVTGLIARAAEAGVVLYACPFWASLLDLEGRLPAGLQSLDEQALLELLQSAKCVIGSL